MKQKFEIPKMGIDDISKLYANIRPIVNKDGTSTFLRELSYSELENISYTWLNNKSDYSDIVDFTKLSILADVKMLHGYGYYGFFKPSVGEIIRQIPKEYLEKVIAFEILRGAVGMNSIFNAELNAGFHVSIVRLYEAKNDANEVAQPVNIYPTLYSKTPIGMTEEEFQVVKELYGQED